MFSFCCWDPFGLHFLCSCSLINKQLFYLTRQWFSGFCFCCCCFFILLFQLLLLLLLLLFCKTQRLKKHHWYKLDWWIKKDVTENALVTELTEFLLGWKYLSWSSLLTSKLNITLEFQLAWPWYSSSLYKLHCFSKVIWRAGTGSWHQVSFSYCRTSSRAELRSFPRKKCPYNDLSPDKWITDGPRPVRDWKRRPGDLT